MKKLLIILLFTALSLFAQMLNIDDFSAEVFSRATKKPVAINLNIVIEGRYVEEESYKIVDALNIVIGSFYLEDLITSQGKQKLKEAIKKYTTSRYGVDIDDIYIQSLKSQPNTKEIIEALKREGMCVK